MMLNDTETRVINHQSYVSETDSAYWSCHPGKTEPLPALSIHAQVLRCVFLQLHVKTEFHKEITSRELPMTSQCSFTIKYTTSNI